MDLNFIDEEFAHIPTIKRKKVIYYNCPAAFDIETSSFTDYLGNRCSTIVCWAFGLNGESTVGRTWEEFMALYGHLVKRFSLYAPKRRMYVYIHNLGYEINFLLFRLKWEKLFFMRKHQPLEIMTKEGVIFRCSFRLSGLSLEKTADGLTKYMCKKLVGNWDYDKIRHTETELTGKEVSYQINDVNVVMCYIQEMIEEYGTVCDIPMTKTGKVRKFIRDHVFGKYADKTKSPYYKYIHNCNLDIDTYTLCRETFAGGFTHANVFKIGNDRIPWHEYVMSNDLTSSYPTVLCAEKYPCESFRRVKVTSSAEFKKYLSEYAVLARLCFTGLTCISLAEQYLYNAKCRAGRNVVLNNGRVIKADYIVTTVTEIDYWIIDKCYRWDRCIIGDDNTVLIAKKGYLPKDYILSILDQYRIKTAYKGVKGKESEYQNNKEMYNANYGLHATDPIRDIIGFDFDVHDYTAEKPDVEKALYDYNKSKNRVTSYPIGVWCTAYARRNVWGGILVTKLHYLYCDTDSIKFFDNPDTAYFVKWYNNDITRKLTAMCRYYNIDVRMLAPMDKKGKHHPLGVWDFEGTYRFFRTMGSKRYIYVDNADYSFHFTVAGCNKKSARQYLLSKYAPKYNPLFFIRNGELCFKYGAARRVMYTDYIDKCLQDFYSPVFRAFTDGLYFPPEESGKLASDFNFFEQSGYLTDYTGKTAKYHEMSCQVLYKTDYTLKLQKDFPESPQAAIKEIFDGNEEIEIPATDIKGMM